MERPIFAAVIHWSDVLKSSFRGPSHRAKAELQWIFGVSTCSICKVLLNFQLSLSSCSALAGKQQYTTGLSIYYGDTTCFDGLYTCIMAYASLLCGQGMPGIILAQLPFLDWKWGFIDNLSTEFKIFVLKHQYFIVCIVLLIVINWYQTKLWLTGWISNAYGGSIKSIYLQ